MLVKLTHSTFRRRVAMLLGTATIATMGLAGSMAGTAQAEQSYEIDQSWCEYADTPADQMPATYAEMALECLINQERANAGLTELRHNDPLHNAANEIANAAVQTKWWCEDPQREEPYACNPHRNPGIYGTHGFAPARFSAAGYCPTATPLVRENDYAGDGAQAPTPREAVRAMMNNPEERENTLNPDLTETGAGIALGWPYWYGRENHEAPPPGSVTFYVAFGACPN